MRIGRSGSDVKHEHCTITPFNTPYIKQARNSGLRNYVITLGSSAATTAGTYSLVMELGVDELAIYNFCSTFFACEQI